MIYQEMPILQNLDICRFYTLCHQVCHYSALMPLSGSCKVLLSHLSAPFRRVLTTQDTCADTLQQLVINAEDAKREWLCAAIEENINIPEPSALDSYSGQFKLRIPKSLHQQLSEHAKQEGISMNQYCLYLLTKFDTVTH